MPVAMETLKAQLAESEEMCYREGPKKPWQLGLWWGVDPPGEKEPYATVKSEMQHGD